MLLQCRKSSTKDKISPIHSCPLAVEEKKGVTRGVKVLIEIQCLKDIVIFQVRGHLLPLTLQT